MIGKTSRSLIDHVSPDFHEHALHLASESKALMKMNAIPKEIEKLMPFIQSVSQCFDKVRNQKSISQRAQR